jgi:hypothetical protein
VILAVIAIIAVLYEAWTNDWGGIREIVATAVKDIEGFLNQLWNTAQTIWNDITGLFKQASEEGEQAHGPRRDFGCHSRFKDRAKQGRAD